MLHNWLTTWVRKAVDARLEAGGGEAGGSAEVGWGARRDRLDVWVRDDGPGLADTANLFVPFYTTKADGTGIGLVLSRQIAEAHGGTVTLGNRPGGSGCAARLSLPLPGTS